jgi:hypothetical protein
VIKVPKKPDVVGAQHRFLEADEHCGNLLQILKPCKFLQSLNLLRDQGEEEEENSS